MNQISILGNITNDPVLKQKDSGTSFCYFGLALNFIGKKQAKFFECKAFNKTAEFIGKYCCKGERVLVFGEYQLDDKDKSFLCINRIQSLTTKKEKENFPKENKDKQEEETNDIPF